MPKGDYRLFKKDKSGRTKFLGEQFVEQKVEEDILTIKSGTTREITFQKRQMDYKQITNQKSQTEIWVTIHNHKESDTEVRVSETLYGAWNMLESSHKMIKRSANHIEFEVPVPKKGQVVLKYRYESGI